MIIDGRQVAQRVRDRVKAEVEELIASGGPQPGLATILVGDDPASQIYVRNKHEKSREAGMVSFNHVLAAGTPQDEVADLIQQLNEDDSVHGILLQLPAPDQIDDEAMTALIDPVKDVDGLTPVNAGLLVQGKPNKLICRDLRLSEGTVKVHVSAILKALNVHSRAQAIVELARRGVSVEATARDAH